jgi:hypothetical protein
MNKNHDNKEALFVKPQGRAIASWTFVRNKARLAPEIVIFVPKIRLCSNEILLHNFRKDHMVTGGVAKFIIYANVESLFRLNGN